VLNRSLRDDGSWSNGNSAVASSNKAVDEGRESSRVKNVALRQSEVLLHHDTMWGI